MSKLPRSKQHRPNILLIMADQHRMDCLGAYGNQDIRTPHIDSLAADGVVYDNSFCSAPFCTPSRYSVMTGLYPHQHLGMSNQCTIPAGIETFPRVLKKNGYRTKAVGKMHFTPTYLDLGFEEMLLAEQHGMGRFEDDYHRYLRQHDLVDRVDLTDQVWEYRVRAPQSYWDNFGSTVSDLPEEHHSTTWIGDRAVEALKAWQPDEANFLMASFIKPHHPMDPPSPWSDIYNPDELTLLPGWTEQCLPRDLALQTGFFPYKTLNENLLKQLMAYYYASISQIDDYVGKMIACLKQQGLYDNTLILYTSDHGDYMGYHHMVLKGNYMYDPLVKVPLIIKYPGQEQGGTRSGQYVNNIDLAPTLIARSGGDHAKHHFIGNDISVHQDERQFIFCMNVVAKQYMVRSRTHKLLLCRNEEQSLFFDLSRDPLEMENVYHNPQYRDLIYEYKQALSELILFDAPAQVHLDNNAPVLGNKNVPDREGRLREELSDWVREKMGSIHRGTIDQPDACK